MIAHLNGKLVEKSPTHVIVECQGVGYYVKISLNSFSLVGTEESLKIYTQFVVREDAQILYGFMTLDEREMFNHLVSVSGIGPNIAMIMLSSLVPQEIAHAIQTEDVPTIQSVKGIGAKTAQRVIIDLKDKMLKLAYSDEYAKGTDNTTRLDALNALVSLGFDKKSADKALDKIAKDSSTVEELIKGALKIL
jgi:Holliday junction DNA helicase RuvA